MSTPPPVSNPSTTSSILASVNKHRKEFKYGPKNPFFAIMGLGGTYLVGKLVRDTYNGQIYETNRKITNLQQETDMQNLRYNFGHWSGNPGMDHFAGWLQQMGSYGPGNLIEKYEAFTIKAHSTIYNVIIPNLIPMGLALAGLYLGFGSKIIHKPLQIIGSILGKSSIPESFRRKFAATSGRAWNGICEGLGKLLSLPFRSLHAFGFSALLAGLGLYTWNRLDDSMSHSGASKFFRAQMLNEEAE